MGAQLIKENFLKEFLMERVNSQTRKEYIQGLSRMVCSMATASTAGSMGLFIEVSLREGLETVKASISMQKIVV